MISKRSWKTALRQRRQYNIYCGSAGLGKSASVNHVTDALSNEVSVMIFWIASYVASKFPQGHIRLSFSLQYEFAKMNIIVVDEIDTLMKKQNKISRQRIHYRFVPLDGVEGSQVILLNISNCTILAGQASMCTIESCTTRMQRV
jgi:Cdc6-like AAA superfamily ATPase